MDSKSTSSRLYSAIFYPCMLAAVMLTGVMLFSSETEDASSIFAQSTSGGSPYKAAEQPRITTLSSSTVSGLSLRWSDTQLLSFLQTALDDSGTEITIEDIILSEDNHITIKAKVLRTVINDLLSSRNIPDNAALLFALRFLPDELPFEAAFQLECCSGMLQLTPVSLAAGGLSLPVNSIPDTVCERFSSLAYSALREQGCTLEHLFITDHTLYLDCNFTADLFK